MIEWEEIDYPPIEPNYMDTSDLPYPVVIKQRCDHCPHFIHRGYCGKEVKLYGVETECVCFGSSR